MEKRLKINNYNGIKFIFLDISNLNENEILQFFPPIQKLAIKDKIKFCVLNITNTSPTQKIKDASINSLLEIENKIGKMKISLFGLSGIKKIIANAVVSKEQYFAKNYDDAVRWIIEQSKNMI